MSKAEVISDGGELRLYEYQQEIRVQGGRSPDNPTTVCTEQ